MFDPGESLRHFMAKSALFWLLRRLGHDVVTETDVYGRNASTPHWTFGTYRGLGTADIIDLTTSAQYEIELSNKPSRWKKKAELYRRDGVEIIIVPVHKMPDDLDGIVAYVDQYIHPD
jgi:hypothetical protein